MRARRKGFRVRIVGSRCLLLTQALRTTLHELKTQDRRRENRGMRSVPRSSQAKTRPSKLCVAMWTWRKGFGSRITRMKMRLSSRDWFIERGPAQGRSEGSVHLEEEKHSLRSPRSCLDCAPPDLPVEHRTQGQILRCGSRADPIERRSREYFRASRWRHASSDR